MLEKIGPELKYLERLFWKFRVSRFSFAFKNTTKINLEKNRADYF